MTEKQIGELFRHYEKYLLTVILNSLYEGCPLDFAYDCLHETFVIALEKQNDEKFNQNPSGWLVKTARFVVENFNRKSTNRLRFHVSDFNFDMNKLPAGTNMFEDLALNIAIEEKIWDKILKELEPDFRVVLIMRYYQEKPLDEIAAELGISKNLLKVRITRMKAQVKKIIKKYVSE